MFCGSSAITGSEGGVAVGTMGAEGTEAGARTLDIPGLSVDAGAVITKVLSSSIANPGVPEPARLAAQKTAMTIAARRENCIETAKYAVGARS